MADLEDFDSSEPAGAAPQRRSRHRSAPARHRTRRSLGCLLLAGALAAGCTAAPEAEPGLGAAREQRAALRPGPPVTHVPPTQPTPPSVPTPPTPPSVPSPPVGVSSFRPASTQAQLAGCTIFPPEHYMNATGVERLPRHARSAEWMSSLGDASIRLSMPSSRVTNGTRGGMPINIVDSRVIGFSPMQINPTWTAKSYRGPYPVPPNPMVQGHPGVWTDQHMIMLDVADCTVYETIGYEPLAFALFGLHTALSGATYRLDTIEQPPLTTNAPNTPMVGQYVMRHEVEQGLVPHVLAFCTDRISTSHVWPARKSDGRLTNPDAMPMGAWIRLSSEVDLSRFSGEARPVAEALRRHGAVLTDYCGHRFRLQLENSGDWNDRELDQLRELGLADFEVVDTSPMMVDPSTWKIR